jgi:hypothetical protein
VSAFAFAKACTLAPARTECWIVHKGRDAVLVTRVGGRWAAFDDTGTALCYGRTRESVASFGLDVLAIRRGE